MADSCEKRSAPVELEETSAKRIKIAGDSISENGSIHGSLKSFDGFQVVKILNVLSDKKAVFLEGRFGNDPEPAVVTLEKTPFSKESLGEFMSGVTTTEIHFHNDIYGNYTSYTSPKLNGIKTTVIHPATEKHIQKFTAHKGHFIVETPEIYEKITLTHIAASQFDLKWVYNILEHKAESDRIVFEDPDTDTGFILLPDLKWDGKQTENLYLMAVCHKRGIKSLRDLTTQEIPLLKNIINKSTVAIKEKYGINAENLRIYVHYQPSYYHFHVHINLLLSDIPGIHAGKAHLLTSVINNLELVGDYYQRANIPFIVRENDALFTKLAEAGHVQKDEETK